MKKALLAVFLAMSATAWSATIIETEKVKELHPTGSLGTCDYKGTESEKPYLAKLPSSERTTGSFMSTYSIHNKKDKYVSWFAIVRQADTGEKAEGHRRLVRRSPPRHRLTAPAVDQRGLGLPPPGVRPAAHLARGADYRRVLLRAGIRSPQ